VRQQSFEALREARWTRFAAELDALDKGGRGGGDFPAAYRLVCQDLALARDRGFSTSLVDRLNALTLRGHQHLYGARVGRAQPVRYLAERFPAAVRRDGHLFALLSLLFYGSALLFFALVLRDPPLIHALLSADQVAEFEAMYDPDAAHYGAPRSTVGDFAAFSFYVSNNVGIALRTVAWGLFAGLGSLFMVLFNGFFLGAIAAHVTHVGFSETFYPFVIGHGSFELTAIVLAGVAGVRIGWPLIAPGRWTRAVALRRAAGEALPLLYGLVVMLLIAAVIEAFWSSARSVPAPVKLGVGAALWLLVGAWLALGGRRRAD
jgi:uncharacterized membrane protein SpoIIM required for sporulation